MGLFDKLRNRYPDISSEDLNTLKGRTDDLPEEVLGSIVGGAETNDLGEKMFNRAMNGMPTDASQDDNIDFGHIVGGAHTNDLGEQEFNKAIK